MEKTTEFEEIRPYYDEELPQIFEELISDPEFMQMASAAMPGMSPDEIVAGMRKCKTKEDFQREFAYKILTRLRYSTTAGLSLDHSSLKNKDLPYTYISNHRDIILDSGFLSILLVDEGMSTVEIAIGDNLLIYPWIKKVVRVNKSFIVQRGLNMRQMLESSKRLSRYMRYAITKKKESIWIAQREGRAKDSNDRTQDSLLKMLTMAGEGDIIGSLQLLNIAPLAISYEYDPCDFLKAKEFQQKRDNPDYKKTSKDDLINMETGLLGYKGRACLRTGNCINESLNKLDRNLSRQELYPAVSAIIDREIHRNYTLYPNNYIAHDLLMKDNQFADKYTSEERVKFEEYLNKQLDKIELENKDVPFLYEKLLIMYANPLKNHIEAIK